MPNLGQLDTSIYGQTKLFPAPGQQAATGRPLAGPTAAQMKFVADQQTEDQINQLAQQYGDDYEGFVNAVAQTHPDRGYAAGKALEEWRKSGAERYGAQAKAASEGLDAGLKLLQGADATNIGERVDSILKENPRLAPVLMPLKANFTPEGLQAVQQIGMNQKEFWDWQARAGDAILNGDKMKGLAAAYAGASSPDQRAIVDRTLKLGGYGKLVGMYPDQQSAQTAFQQMDALKPEKPASEGSDLKQYATKWARDHGKTYDQMTTADMDAMNVEREKTMRKPVVAGVAGAGPLTGGEGGGLELAGTMMRLTGRVPVGMSRSGLAAQVTNEAARQNKMVGQTPVAMMQKSAVYQGDQKALASLQKQAGAADAYETKALAQLDIVDGLSDQVWRTKSPLINRAILAGQTEIAGDKDATLLLNAIQTASNEYAKIMMGGTASAQALSDSASKEAQRLLNAGMSKGTLRGATALMRQEMGLTMNGYDAAQKHILENMGGAAGAPQAPQMTPPPSGQTQKIGRFTVTVK